MPSIEFNVSGAGQHLLIQHPSEDFDPKSNFTIEAIGTPLAAGQDPTVIARPTSAIWTPPFVTYRLGFHSDTLLPEFQLLVEGEAEPTVARSTQPAQPHEQIHLAGTFDGETIRLFVNGLLVAESRNRGVGAKSKEPVVIGARSASDLGGFYAGRLYEIRFWKVARSPEEIQFWHNRIYPLPAPSECFALYQTAGGLGYETAKQLRNQGYSDKEIAWGSFSVRYAAEFNRLAPERLSAKTKGRLGESIHQSVLVKARDGYLAFYEPGIPEYVPFDDLGIDKAEGGTIILNRSMLTISELLQTGTRNLVKVAYPPIGQPLLDKLTEPPNMPQASDEMLLPRFRHKSGPLPTVMLLPNAETKAGNVVGVHSGRWRIVSPLIVENDGTESRLFSWAFVDCWFGELSWDFTFGGLAEQVVSNDFVALEQVSDLPPELPQARVIPPSAKLPIEDIIEEFERLISQPDVQEVRDIQPYLADPKRWFLLDPSCKNVWSQKMLGNKYKVDYVVQASTDAYTAIEIESPHKMIYKRDGDPHSDLSHAEQQVRDYCNYIDSNRDTVDREEGLTGIFHPRGIVVMGRRKDLNPTGLRKLRERNADESRYLVKTYDDLLDQARQMATRLKDLF